MANDKASDVLVVGAGPVGLFAALSLAKKGVPVQIVDTGVWACTHSYALALHPQSLALMHQLGIAEHILEHAYPVRTIGFYDAHGRRAQIQLGSNGGDDILAVLPQESLEGLLERELAAKGVPVGWRHEAAALEQKSGHVEAVINRYEKESRGYVVAHSEWVVAKSTRSKIGWVIGADGYTSRVRRALGIEFPEVAPAQYYAVFEFKCDTDLAHEMRVVFGESTTDVLWPLPNGYCRWSFELPEFRDPEQQQRDAAGMTYPARRFKDRRLIADWGESSLEKDDLLQLISARAPWFPKQIEDLTWRTVIRFEHRLATSFGNGRMWLTGDAAHLTGPAAIQSMNFGLAEAAELVNAVSGSGKEEALRAYGERWLSEWHVIQGLNGGLQADGHTDPWVRQNAPKILTCLPAHGAELQALARQLKLRM